MEPLGCPETSVTTNLHYVTTRESEDSHLHGVGRLKCVNLKLSVSKKAKSGSNPNILWTSTAAGDTFVSGLLAILLHQEGNIEGDGDNREETSNRSYRKQPFYCSRVTWCSTSTYLHPACCLGTSGSLAWITFCCLSPITLFQF